MTFIVIKYNRAVLFLLVIINVTQRDIGNLLGVLKHTRVETATEIMLSLVKGGRGAGALENRGREREGSGRTGGGKRDLYEGGKREQK